MAESYFPHILLVLAVVLAAAKIAGHVARRLGQPSVLGELAAGIILGNLSLAGYRGFEPWKTDPTIDIFAQLGVILIVFQVGIESTVREMLDVGASAVLAGVLGSAGSFALGWAAAVWLAPSAGSYSHLFLGATLSATSVSITARVLKDLGKSRTREARIILGAAVVDDVLGLVMLAVSVGAIASAASGTAMSAGPVVWTVVKASLFLFGAIAAGVAFSPRIFALAARLQANGALLATGLTLCFLFAWLAAAIGLAPIIGAFAAGVVLEDAESHAFVARGEQGLDALLEVLASFLGPVFFVMVGARTNLAAFAHLDVAGLAAGLCVAAILGKQLCALGVIGRKIDRLSIGIGMIPRGEVQLIFASLGLTLSAGGHPIVDRDMFAAIVIVVIVTTLLTPPALKWSLARRR